MCPSVQNPLCLCVKGLPPSLLLSHAVWLGSQRLGCWKRRMYCPRTDNCAWHPGIRRILLLRVEVHLCEQWRDAKTAHWRNLLQPSVKSAGSGRRMWANLSGCHSFKRGLGRALKVVVSGAERVFWRIPSLESIGSAWQTMLMRTWYAAVI